MIDSRGHYVSLHQDGPKTLDAASAASAAAAAFSKKQTKPSKVLIICTERLQPESTFKSWETAFTPPGCSARTNFLLLSAESSAFMHDALQHSYLIIPSLFFFFFHPPREHAAA